MADSLIQFWNQQLVIYQHEQGVAHDELAKRQAPLQTANAKLAANVPLLTRAGSDIPAARAKLSITTIPADANQLIADITKLIIEQRRLQGLVLDDQEQAADAQVSIDS